MKKRMDVPETIDDDTWWRIQKGTASQIPLIDGPWVDPAAASKKERMMQARECAADN